MADFISVAADWIMNFLMHVGLWGIFLALAVESACIPITSEVFLLFGGFLVAQGRFGLAETAVAGTLGFVVGSLIPYYVGRRHGRTILGKGGRFFLASERELDRVEEWFARYGAVAILFGRVVPVVRDFISLPAGHARVPLAKFLFYTALGTFPWIFGVTFLGTVLEAEWSSILDVFDRANKLVLGLIAIIALFLVIRRLRRRDYLNGES